METVSPAPNGEIGELFDRMLSTHQLENLADTSKFL